MITLPNDIFREPTPDDVLKLDVVGEYDRRQMMRQVADNIVAETGDDSSVLVSKGRPTGP
ncbi:MAG TPA: hypothetical protein VJN22_04055 [Candidatus Eremiobacteraceae bacterium]|nr:hypothetical protein [Candidatus Eremiobacteraceae bacterium]